MTSFKERPLLAIVDDEPFMAQLVSDMLSCANVDKEVFLLGADFLKSPNLLKFKTIILDLSLPDIDGFDLMDKLAANTIGMSVLLISGHSNATINAAKIYGRGIGLNMCGALTKPFARDQLLAALELSA